jgi:hypothetical protein
MKKYGWLLGLILIVFTGCNKDDNKDVTQLSFSFTNLTTLLGQNGSTVKQASPGTFFQYLERTDYSVYTYLFDEITVLDTMAINYHMTGDKCDDIAMYTQSSELAKAQELMLIANQEYGEASVYVLDYISDSTVYEISFYTYSSLWAYINDNSYTREDIVQVYSMYAFDNNTTYAGGFWQNGDFWPFGEIQSYGKKSTAIKPPFRSWKGDLTRQVFHL